MTDTYPGPFTTLGYDRYDQRSTSCIQPRSLVILILSGLPIILFCGIYLIILNSDQRLIYPKCCNYKVPKYWIERAKIYNDNTSFLIIKNNDITPIENNYFNQKKTQTLNLLDDEYEYKLICYYNFPSTTIANENDINKLLPNTIDPFLCTHINVAFVTIKNNTLYVTKQQIDVIKQLVQMKEINDNLKILISVGGAGNGNGFGDMVFKHTNRKIFIHSVVIFVKTYKIDGIDLDWEFPNRNQSGDKQQIIHFTQLLGEFRTAINKQVKHKFLLSVAVAAPDFLVDMSYNVPHMNEYVDYINVMTYDYHYFTKLTPFTGFNAPLYSTDKDNAIFINSNINHSTNYWHMKGMDKKKIIVGLPTYGHSFRLMNSQNNGIYAPARGYGTLGSLGFVDFAQVCKFLDLNRIKPFFDLEARSPYATKSLEWISFDNEQSLSFKAEFIRDQQYGGAMIYSLNTDDHRGICQFDKRVPAKQFALTRKVREILSTNYSIF